MLSASNWLDWAAAESRRRLLAGCFLLDGHNTLHLGPKQATTTRIGYGKVQNLSISLVYGTMAAWEASTSVAWVACQLDMKLATAGQVLGNATAVAKHSSASLFDASILETAAALQLVHV